MDIAREDLSLFLNACAAATAQREFYSSEEEQRVSLTFLHEYICGNYRTLYARTLAAGINHHNQAEVIFQLLSTGKACPPDFRATENQLITAALRQLPSQRAWKLLQRLQRSRVNNRRTRKVIEGFIQSRNDLPFDAVKYRHKVKASMQHAHMKSTGEVSRFLFEGLKKPFETPLLEQYRTAHYSKEALYDLPYSIAEGFAAKHGVSRKDFLKRIEGKLTERERLRVQNSSEGKIQLNPEKLSLTELCSYVLGLSLQERRSRGEELMSFLTRATRATLRRAGRLPLPEHKVAAILDNSYSSSGSSMKQNRPLAVAMSADFLLGASCSQYRAFWTHPVGNPLLNHPKGQTYLAERLLDALEWGAQTVLVVSDACENDVPDAFEQTYQAYRRMGGKASIIHLSPVFDAETYQVKPLLKDLPALGIRAGEDLATTLAFARFSARETTLLELETYLQSRVDALIGQLERQP
ncbi:hypothetical protein [Deinococcus cellulosilyticus]|uniref:TROVE domain-containing protein n=1 Tax=Deinococcus cellulosilyticus (strain DSM 18568 / NBRC 106333 / KACC 11606 / 5516J-15) TaxID=1223518 RepID=A0A511N571_DEIC1|nr:hypothetical protein [Deinococcus cellulosilyticus]GEM47627.1 hypothetical protein DC3_32620 [Deinococcus cellulosilyticus NBRC 106333 = KACC 11606]